MSLTLIHSLLAPESRPTRGGIFSGEIINNNRMNNGTEMAVEEKIQIEDTPISRVVMGYLQYLWVMQDAKKLVDDKRAEFYELVRKEFQSEKVMSKLMEREGKWDEASLTGWLRSLGADNVKSPIK